MIFGTKIYTVHVQPNDSLAGEKPVFVREGFNVYAFALTALWLLYKRLWLQALLVLGYNLLLVYLAKNHALNHAGVLVLHAAMHVLIGFHANDWLRTRLTKRGYILADISAGDSLLRAEQRYFERYLAA